MSTHLIEGGGGRPLLDIASYARRGPGRRDRLSASEIELIERTVRRTPEVMVKVLSKGGQNLGAVRRHLDYLSRGGEVKIETDDGQGLSGKGAQRALLEDWDLDLDAHRRRLNLDARPRKSPPKLVHKLMFSMPAGTPPDKVLLAVQNFAREEFGLKHRYAMVLHTDEPHPHVHMVVKALSEQGVRLNIRKATLREWRREFAQRLRALGVAANATERAVRGESRSPTLDGIYRAQQRGEARHVRGRAEAVARRLGAAEQWIDSGKSTLLETRSEVERGWRAASDILRNENRGGLAERIYRFVSRMTPPQSDSEQAAPPLTQMSRRQVDKDRPSEGR